LSGDADDYSGVCAVCGREGVFTRGATRGREGYPCGGCRSSIRYRHQAEVLVALYARERSRSLAELVREAEFRRLAVYEPGVSGTLRRYDSDLADYVHSYYWTDIAPGDFKQGVRCENLEQLTFQDESFDLVITSDVFEHVRRPWHAFAEVGRILRPGGRHVFTVPFNPRRDTRPRLDPGEDGDLLLMPRRYHGSPIEPEESLLYTDFGRDLPERLELLGFEVIVHEARAKSFTFACERK
jgi:SAM-dependent methyltransferase